jgi:hypothetical protein
LIDGLTEIIYNECELKDRFKDKYWIGSILLPSNGTILGDLVNLDYSEWVEVIDTGIVSFEDKVEEFYLLDFYTGTSLTLHHALRKIILKI